MPVQTVIKTRRDTAANWLASTAVLAVGEAGLETDTRLVKYGNGADVWIDLEYASTAVVKEIVKNSTGSTISKGQAVYVSGSNGDNALISLADADSESTSSKTLGLAVANITDGSLGAIITNGLLKGIDTSTATAGDSVWLSSTAGGVVFGAPPAKPAHNVYIGVVVRVHATTGAILVKVQNGYEVNELHDVNITGTVANNEVLAYDDASSMWINQTAAEAGLAVAGHTHALDDLTDVSAATPSPSDVLSWNGTAWVNAAPAGGLPSQTGNAGELLVTDGTDASWSNTVTANSASVPAIIAKGAASQTANLQQWQNSSGTVLAAVASNGNIYSGNGSSVFAVLRPTGTGEFKSNSSGVVTLTINGASGQSSNLQNWADSSGTVLASVESDGKINAKPIVPGDAQTASNLGYVGMPQVSTSTGLTVNNAHAGKHIYTTATGQTHTIAANASVPMEIGTTFVFINPASVTTTIAITSDTLILAGTGTTGSRTLAPYGMATAVKITSTSWMISGTGLS